MAVERFQVFAVEDHAIQLSWGALGAGRHDIVVRGEGVERGVEVEGSADGGPGTVVVDGLPSGVSLEVTLDGGVVVASASTLTPPPGVELSRLATISDLHFGERSFGRLPRIHDPLMATDPFWARCTRAAVAEALAWGAQMLIVKGDVSDHGRESEYDAFGTVVGGLPVPVRVLAGNHDGGDHPHSGDVEGALARHGLSIVSRLSVVDLPGLRVVAANSRVRGWRRGSLDVVLDELAGELRSAPGGALVATHHHPVRTIVPTHWPPGLVGWHGHRLLDTVVGANPATLITAGHSHRHRRRNYGPVVVTEVGSPKDYPGTWAGYVVHEGGIRQVVRRVAEPSAIAWTERTRKTVLGSWGHWSPGRLADRCFTHVWPAREP